MDQPNDCVAEAGTLVAGRLKEELHALEQASRAWGMAVGKKWVGALQLPADLRAVQQLSEKFGAWRNALYRDLALGVYTAAEGLVFLMYPTHNGDRRTARRFWALHAGDIYPDIDFVEGFAAAAVEEWELLRRRT